MRWRVCVRRECSPKLEIVVRRSLWGAKVRAAKELGAKKSALHHPATLPPPKGGSRGSGRRSQTDPQFSFESLPDQLSFLCKQSTCWHPPCSKSPQPISDLLLGSHGILGLSSCPDLKFALGSVLCPPLSSFKCFFLVKRSFGYNDLFHTFIWLSQPHWF